MRDIYIKQTSKTPEIKFLATKGVLELKGVSIPEDAEKIYAPLLDWAEEYVRTTHNKETHFIFKLVYFNTSTSDYLVGLLKSLKHLYEKDGDLTIDWYYEEDDEDMIETGSHFQAIIGVNFNFISCIEIL